MLAGTLSVLGGLPLTFLTEIGFVAAFGVLLDTFLVRSVLVPALVPSLGESTWWPSSLARSAPASPGGADGNGAGPVEHPAVVVPADGNGSARVPGAPG